MPKETTSMPDEKIDRKRPAQAESEPKVEQQRHVDDTVDDSFPASDPPAWTTTGAKSVAARCEPEEASGTSSGSTEATDEAGRQQGALGQASRFVEEAYETGRRYVHDAQQRLPGAARSIPQVRRAVAQPVETYPLTALILAGAAGFGLAWFIYGSQAGRGRRELPAHGKRSQYGWRPTPMTKSEQLGSLSRAAGAASSAQSGYSE
jgi:hypothetical protein